MYDLVLVQIQSLGPIAVCHLTSGVLGELDLGGLRHRGLCSAIMGGVIEPGESGVQPPPGKG